MVVKIINNFAHRPGYHCGSTSLANAMNYYGYSLGEAMCFGLGSGLGFFFLIDGGYSPGRVFSGRASSLERYFFRNMGLPFSWNKGDEFQWDSMRSWLDRDVPVLLLTDLYYLDYFQTSTHFGGHSVLLVGYDSDREVVFLSDSEREDIQENSLKSLARAMKSDAMPFQVRNHWKEVAFFELPPLNDVIRRALINNCNKMLYPPQDYMGIPGMKKLAADLPGWRHEAEDWQWCARYGYQVIEKRGTGGGGFRKLYYQYLCEAEEYLPVLKEIQAARRMEQISRQWSEMACVLKKISETGEDLFGEAGSLAGEICSAEESFFVDVLYILNEN